MVDKGDFREDLYYRLNVVQIQMPSLADRAEDLPLLLNHFLEEFAEENEMDAPTFEPGAIQALRRYAWPGNIRELRNVIERATVLFPARNISGKNVRENLLRLKVPNHDEEQNALWEASAGLTGVSGDTEDGDATQTPLPHPSHYQQWFAYFDHIDIRRHLSDVEAVLIEAALEKTDGKISSAADALKLRRTTLIEKMKKLMIERPISAHNEEREAS